MISKAKAPLRLGLAGGGTDVSPYCDLFGGEVLNAAISLYAYAAVSPIEGDDVILKHEGLDPVIYPKNQRLVPRDDLYDLHGGVLNRFLKQYGAFDRGFRIETKVDVALGSGLGTSSTLIVAIIGALLEYRGIVLHKREIAAMACSIERDDLRHPGGKQDQYAACFGGLNTLKFLPDGEVVIDPVIVSEKFLDEFQQSLILYYTSHSRHSGKIIEEQILHVQRADPEPLEAMHQLKKQSRQLRAAFAGEDFDTIASVIDEGFGYKKKMAAGISNQQIENIYAAAKEAGALAGKISGAGGGGFMIFCVSAATAGTVRKALLNFAGREYRFQFDREGLITWRE